jgi:ATP-dependent helicase HrpB
VSQASAQQRAGRAGRTRPGRCLRLVTRREFGGFSPFTTPELQRADLSGVVLALKGSGVSDPRDLPWLQPPPEPALEAAESLLRRLGALDDDGNLTAVGTQMLAHPTHPRLARVLQEADTRGVLPSGALVVSVLENPDPREGRRWSGEKRGHSKDSGTHPSDPILVAEELNTASVAPGERKRILTNARLYAHGRKAPERFDPPTFQALCRSLLAGYPDRVARRVSEGSQEVYLSSGGRAFLCPESSVRKAEFLVALEAREDPNRGGRTIVAQASAIEPEWLFDLSAESVRESREVRWNSRQERVEVVEHLLYDKLVLHEHAQRADQCPEAAELLAQEALKAGLGRFFGEEALERFLARMAFLQSVAPKLDVPDERRAEQVLRDACRGRASFRQLEDSDLMSRLRYGCSPGAQRALAALAPEQIPLPSGQRLTIQYPKDGRPFAKAAIQAFYGMKGTPTVGGGRVPVQLHLLAPSRRPAQITDDLPRFWSGTYELVRKELRGRYPKHYWPDDPANAAPVQLRRDA